MCGWGPCARDASVWAARCWHSAVIRTCLGLSQVGRLRAEAQADGAPERAPTDAAGRETRGARHRRDADVQVVRD